MLRDGAKLLVDYAEGLWGEQGAEQVTVEMASPTELEGAFRKAGCDLDLAGGATPLTDDKVLDACRLALRYAVRTNHPRFFNQLYGRVEAAGLLGSWLTTTTAGNCHTYEVAPVFTLTEKYVLQKLCASVGFPAESEGLFVPGGSIANLYGIHLARYRAFPQAKTEGLWGCPPLVMFVSTHAHYSYAKASHVMGLGTSNVVKVATDREGRMRVDALEEAVAAAVAAGKKPFCVGATCGTTVLGAFDDLVALRSVCDQHSMWLHVDACWGGAAVLAGNPATRELMAGLGNVDSCSWNPHKLMGIPMQCSPFLTRHPGLLLECNSYGAAYLFQPDKKFTELDIGDKTIQCGRLPDSFKLWLAWKNIGDQGWAQRVDKAVHLAEHMRQKMEGSYKGRFKLVVPLNFTNLSFWYFPPSMKDFDPHTVTPESEEWKSLHSVAVPIKARMQEQGKALIGFQSISLEGDVPVPNFFRMVVASAWSVTERDIEETLMDIDNIGAELFPAPA